MTTPSDLHVYDREIDSNERTSLSVLSAQIPAGARVLDAVIAPEDTRSVIVDSLAALRAKNDARPDSPKKHDNIPL